MDTIQRVTDEVLAGLREEMEIRRTNEVFLVFSLGCQFDHLNPMKLAKIGVYAVDANPATMTADDVRRLNPKGIILTGGPASVHEDPPPFDRAIFELGIKTLGICLGFQLMGQYAGMDVQCAKRREYGRYPLKRHTRSPLFHGLPNSFTVLQSHGDEVPHDPQRLWITASTDNCPVAAAEFLGHPHLFGIQFHPETSDTEFGDEIFENFCFRICGARDRFPATDAARAKIERLRPLIAGKRVGIALSGGNDSSITAYLLKEAANHDTELFALYIRGADRPDDADRVMKYFGDQPWIKLVIVDATDEILKALQGVRTMKAKRRVFKPIYVKKLCEFARAFGINVLAQGTLHTDINESGGRQKEGEATARKAVIKEHHNVGIEEEFRKCGLEITLLEPLDDEVKDTARAIGRAIGVPEALMTAHPFPGPGIIIRIIGEVTREKIEIQKAADQIFIEELRRWSLYESVWQAAAVVTDTMTTVTKGSDSGEGCEIILWAVASVNGFTATPIRFEWDFLMHVSRRITNEIRGAGMVTYRLSEKPPATIEVG